MAYVTQPGSGEWRHGLFDCCESCTDCMLAYCCFPCYAFMASQAAGNDTLCSILVCCFPIGLCCVRGNARAARNIDGSALSDCLAVYCCGCCSAIQIKREFSD